MAASALWTAHPKAGSIVPDTIAQLLEVAAHRDPDGIWLRCDEGTMSFAGAASQVAALSQSLAAQGIGHGDLVVLTARTTPPYLLCWLALACLGAVSVPTDPAGTADELAGLVHQVRPKAILSDADLTNLWGAAAVDQVTPAPALMDVDVLAGAWRAGRPSDSGPSDSGPSDSGPSDSGPSDSGPSDSGPSSSGYGLGAGVAPEDLAVLIPTSGTTGRSKLVMQTHRAYAMAGEGFPYWMEIDHTDRMLTCLPLFHINAPAYSVLGSLACGAGLVLLPRFSASGFLDSARQHGATQFNAIGAMLEILMRQPVRRDDADHPLRLCYTGPSPTQEWQEAFERRFGLRVVCGFGMSESPYGLIWRHGTRPFGTLGSPRQHPRLGTVNQVRVVDEHGRECGPGEQGELLLRNPAVTPGYWGMPEETAATIVDGWLHTGDLVTVNPDGTYTFVARRKEVLRRRGQNLSPAEVEQAIATHPDVLEVAVVGVASELTEDEVKAFVVARPQHRLDFAALASWTGARLSAFKVPRYWQELAALPRTPTARVAKHRLPSGRPPDEYDAQAVPDGSRPDRRGDEAGR